MCIDMNGEQSLLKIDSMRWDALALYCGVCWENANIDENGNDLLRSAYCGCFLAQTEDVEIDGELAKLMVS